MEKQLEQKIGNESLPSIIKDPFNQFSAKRVYVSFSERFNGRWAAIGSVEFQNGNTKGEQCFEGPDFDDVVRQIKLFLDEIKRKS